MLNEDVKQVGSTYGPITAAAYASANAPISTPVAQRIAQLAEQLTDAAHKLENARIEERSASAHLATCQATFAKISAALLSAIQEHREGTPEGVPYRRPS